MALNGPLANRATVAKPVDPDELVSEGPSLPTSAANAPHPDAAEQALGDFTTTPVATTHLDGLTAHFDLLKAREKFLGEERHTERLLTPNWIEAPRALEKSS